MGLWIYHPIVFFAAFLTTFNYCFWDMGTFIPAAQQFSLYSEWIEYMLKYWNISRYTVQQIQYNLSFTLDQNFNSKIYLLETTHQAPKLPSHLNGIIRNFRTRVFAPGFYFFLYRFSTYPVGLDKWNSYHFLPGKNWKWELIFNQCNQVLNSNTASFRLWMFQLLFNQNRLYSICCGFSASFLLTPRP